MLGQQAFDCSADVRMSLPVELARVSTKDTAHFYDKVKWQSHSLTFTQPIRPQSPTFLVPHVEETFNQVYSFFTQSNFYSMWKRIDWSGEVFTSELSNPPVMEKGHQLLKNDTRHKSFVTDLYPLSSLPCLGLLLTSKRPLLLPETTTTCLVWEAAFQREISQRSTN